MKNKIFKSFFLNKYFLFLLLGITPVFSSYANLNSDCDFTFGNQQLSKTKIIIYYVEGATYKSTFKYNDETYSYLIDSNKKVLFLNAQGEQVNLNLKLFNFVNIKDRGFDVDVESEEVYDDKPIFFQRIVSSENFTNLAKPLTISYEDLKSDLNEIINRGNGVNSKDTQYLIFRFDINQDGLIDNVRNETSDDSRMHQSIINYLNNLDDWQPSDISGELTTSTFEIKIIVPYIYKETREIINEHKQVTPKEQ